MINLLIVSLIVNHCFAQRFNSSLALSDYNWIEIGNDIRFTAGLKDKNTLQFVMEAPKNGYLALGFGTDMEDDDMVVVMQMDGNPTVFDLYSPDDDDTPEFDDQQDWTLEQSQDLGNGNILYVINRNLTTSDQAFDQQLIFDEYDMEWAYLLHDDFEYHFNNIGLFSLKFTFDSTFQFFESVSLTEIENRTTDNTLFKLHGGLMWTAWGLISLLQLFSGRWLKKCWKWNMWVHLIMGSISLLLTITFALIVAAEFGMSLTGSLHSFVGLAILVLSAAQVIGGFIAYCLNYKLKKKAKVILVLKTIHQFNGYFVIAISQFTLFSGFVTYRNFSRSENMILFIIHIIIWTGTIIAFEVYHQVSMRRKVYITRESLPIMQETEFQQHCEKGRQLTIFDDYVLDIEKYKKYHPGGQFLLDACVGRDVSKFIYGGYILEAQTGLKPHYHSGTAFSIMNDLVIAKLGKPCAITQVKIVDQQDINSYTKTINFESKDKLFKTYYPGINMIGKHYLFEAEGLDKCKRHYTISNCMEREVYAKYTEALQSAINGESPQKIEMSDNDSDKVTVTIKTYDVPRGLATNIHKNNRSLMYTIQGPMGQGLLMQKSGTHVAFCGGTGILVFMDLVAHLVRKQLKQLESQEQDCVSDDFRLVLFASFASRKDSIGLEMVEKLDQLCKSNKSNQFSLILRLSDEGGARWNQDFVVKELKKLEESPKRVWVCGPPVMNEGLDMIFKVAGEQVGLSRHMVDVM